MPKVAQAIQIIKAFGLPGGQRNSRSALTLLALLDLKEEENWDAVKRPMLGVTPIMEWIFTHYQEKYAPNSRETFRRQTLHQFVDGGLCLYNPDEPDRPVNSPNACYQVAEDAFQVIKSFGTDKWKENIEKWKTRNPTLVEQYAKERKQALIPLTIKKGEEIYLSPGDHSSLIKEIVEQFAPRFVGGSRVVYLGDTGAKEDFFDRDLLSSIGVEVDRKGKLPDVILYHEDKNWLILVESVTSHGPIDGKRYFELTALFGDCKAGLVFVTAFPDNKTFRKYVSEISWETEVWLADKPSHMIHFNGDNFLGPHQ